MRIPTVLLTGASALALTIGVANAKPKGSIYQWIEVHDNFGPTDKGDAVNAYDGTFDSINKCNADIKTKIDSSVQPPCPVNNQNSNCSTGGTYTFYRCLQGVFGTPLQ